MRLTEEELANDLQIIARPSTMEAIQLSTRLGNHIAAIEQAHKATTDNLMAMQQMRENEATKARVALSSLKIAVQALDVAGNALQKIKEGV